MPDCLSGEDLSCIRGERLVFTRLSFRIESGGALLLRGPNGSGKSSLLRLIAGLGPPATGVIAWNGEHVARDRGAHRARIAYAGHADAIKPALTAAENLRFWTGLRGDSPDAAAALARLGLDATSLSALEGLLARHRQDGGMVVLSTHVDLALGGAETLDLGAFAVARPAPLQGALS